jgi:hypothetical protein
MFSSVIPAKAGIQSTAGLDTGFRRCDGGKSVGVCAWRWSAELWQIKWNEDNCTSLVQANTFNPCFCTTANSLSAMPLGRFAPASHF